MKKSRGFTLIEVLTVIGIIGILAAMLFLGARYMSASAKKDTTRTMLGNLRAMSTEREQALGAARVRTDFDTTLLACDASVIKDISDGSPNRTGAAVTQTQTLLNMLIAIPANKKMLGGISPDRYQKDATGIVMTFLDGYGNPIIACPSTGLANVILNGGAPAPVRATDGKPFFASAGRDGNIQTGDDNIYSFEN